MTNLVPSIDRLEKYLLDAGYRDEAIETTEKFVGNLYVREIVIPKNCVLTSRVYKRAYADIMLSGDITIQDSNGTYRLQGANVLEGPSGRKRAGYAHEETRWVTVHDVCDIKSKPIEDISFATIEEYLEDRKNIDSKDYLDMLDECGVDADLIRKESERSDNFMERIGP